MDTTLAFTVCNNLALAGWLFLLIFPNWKYTLSTIAILIVFALSVVYTVLIIQALPDMKPDVFSSLASIKKLFQNDTALLAGWVHYLAFDLFMGAYIVRRGHELHIPRWTVTLILPFTFLFGPVGYVLFQSIAFIKPTAKP